MDRNGHARSNEPDCFRSLLPIHSDHNAEDVCPAKVNEGKVNLWIALRNLLQAIIQQRIAGNVKAHKRLTLGHLKLQHTAHHGRKQFAKRSRRVPGRHRTDAQHSFSFCDSECLPGFERVCRTESFLFENFCCLARRHNWQRFVELLCHYTIKMVLVHVGEDDQVKRRQLVDFYSRISSARRAHSIAQVCLFATMQEVWVGQDREACITENNRGRSNKENRASISIRLVIDHRQNQFFCTSHISNDRDCCLAATIPVTPPFMIYLQGLKMTRMQLLILSHVYIFERAFASS